MKLEADTTSPDSDGLTKTGEHYEEAIKYLQTQYNHPYMLNQMHALRIVDAPSLRDGMSWELRTLHDTIIQHLKALKDLGHEPFKEFITSLFELKRHGQAHTDAPDCDELLKFFDLRAQAATATIVDKKPMHPPPNNKDKPVPAFAASTKEAGGSCIRCKGEKAPLYHTLGSGLRRMMRWLPCWSLHSHSLNCLHVHRGHFVKDCKSLHHCKVCQRPHHALVHIDKPLRANHSNVQANHASVRIQSNALFTTCQVFVQFPQKVMQVRALLDSGSAVSFVSERVAQVFRLCRSPQNIRIYME